MSEPILSINELYYSIPTELMLYAESPPRSFPVRKLRSSAPTERESPHFFSI